jgi:hypothetical protein
VNDVSGDSANSCEAETPRACKSKVNSRTSELQRLSGRKTENIRQPILTNEQGIYLVLNVTLDANMGTENIRMVRLRSI